MKILCVFGKYNYGNPKMGEGYEYSNILPGLINLGHEVIFFDSQDHNLYGDFLELNKAILVRIEKERPEIVFVVEQQYEIWLETWSIIKNAGFTATVNWTTDDSWKYSQFSRFLAPYFHAFTTTYPEVLKQYYQDGHKNVILTQWAANSNRLKQPISGKECKYSVSFVGVAHGNRKKWIKHLSKNGINVDCFGYGWPNGPINTDQISYIMQNSVISLNFANTSLVINRSLRNKNKQIKARTFEVPGSGGFLLTEWAEGLNRYYLPGKEIEIFHNIDELTHLINYYLTHLSERDDIAWNGYERTRKEHIYENRLKEVLSFTIGKYSEYINDTNNYLNHNIDWQYFSIISKAHNNNKTLKIVKSILVRFCTIFLGKDRGWRAARRIVFEISWRLTGSRTYSSSSWPGRMFYK